MECEARCHEGPQLCETHQCAADQGIALQVELLEIHHQVASMLCAFIGKRAEYFPRWQVSASAIREVLLDQAKEGRKFACGAWRRQPNHETEEEQA